MSRCGVVTVVMYAANGGDFVSGKVAPQLLSVRFLSSTVCFFVPSIIISMRVQLNIICLFKECAVLIIT